MTVFTEEVDLVWMLDYNNNYRFDQEGNCYNIKTSKKLSRTVVGYTEGYCIESRFKSLTFLRKHLIKVEEVNCPF